MRGRRLNEEGFTMVELLLTCGLVVTLSAAAIPQTLTGLDAARAETAARHMASRTQWARLEAAARGTYVGLRFERDASGGYRCTAYIDGNRNGIRTRDIQQGVDAALGAAERLSDLIPGAEFAIGDGIPPVGASQVDADPNPIRLGGAGILSVSPTGTASSGTLYLRVRRAQFAVRILGATGRARVLAFDRATRSWRPR